MQGFLEMSVKERVPWVKGLPTHQLLYQQKELSRAAGPGQERGRGGWQKVVRNEQLPGWNKIRCISLIPPTVCSAAIISPKPLC